MAILAGAGAGDPVESCVQYLYITDTTHILPLCVGCTVTCKLKCSLLNITFQFLNVLDRVFCAFINTFKIYKYIELSFQHLGAAQCFSGNKKAKGTTS